tara:strand:- start:2488 stop:2880 length:393 start_codon:yes stop_codon:yes gene_type:complete
MTAVATPISSYLANSIAEGFFFECSCGELYSSVSAASGCRKCRNYHVFGYCTHVKDIRTWDVVWGKEPSKEEYEAQAEVAQQQWAAEREYLDMLERMDREEIALGLVEPTPEVELEEWEVYEAKAEAEGY